MTDDVECSEAEKERAAIVAWLRGESEGNPRPTIWRYYADQRGEYVHDLADAIERGDHLQETAND